MKCWECGGKATVTRKRFDTIRFYDDRTWFTKEVKPTKYHRCYCKDCLERVEREEKEELNEYIRLKKRMMFLRACNILEKQHTDMYDFREAIDVVENFVETNPDKFDSAYEVLAAIVLVHSRIYAKMQQKVGKYQVDFLLPDLLTVLEIDGDRHKHRKTYDNKRDKEIKKILGVHWEVIRINTEYLDQNAKALPKAIHAVLDKR